MGFAIALLSFIRRTTRARSCFEAIAKETMRRLLSSSVFIILLLSFTASPASAGEEVTGSRRSRRFGYFFPRSRGRCTPLYWSSSREAWPSTVIPDSAVSSVFGSGASELYGSSGLTLLESTAGDADGQDAFGRLLRQGTASLLNSYARVGFPYTAWEVKTLLIQGMVSRQAADVQARRFALANEACD